VGMIDISKLKDLIKVEESDTDVFIYIGYIRICSISEDEGRWYPSNNKTELFTINGYASKQDALDAVIRHLTD
jgi:hypothetical protein